MVGKKLFWFCYWFLQVKMIHVNPLRSKRPIVALETKEFLEIEFSFSVNEILFLSRKRVNSIDNMTF